MFLDRVVVSIAPPAIAGELGSLNLWAWTFSAGTVSYGSLCPMLRKLEERRCVVGTVEEQTGPNRSVYQITPEGEVRFLELMRDPGAPFTLKMLFFQSIPPPDRKQLLERQRDEWARKLEERHRAAPDGRIRFHPELVPDYEQER